MNAITDRPRKTILPAVAYSFQRNVCTAKALIQSRRNTRMLVAQAQIESLGIVTNDPILRR